MKIFNDGRNYITGYSIRERERERKRERKKERVNSKDPRTDSCGTTALKMMHYHL